MKANCKQAAPVLVVTNEKEAITWYQKTLGFEAAFINRKEGDETGDSWNYALIRNGGVEIHLTAKNPAEEVLRSPTSCYLFLYEIENLHSQLKKISADVTDLQKMPWGTECWLNDPYGNRIVLSA